MKREFIRARRYIQIWGPRAPIRKAYNPRLGELMGKVARRVLSRHVTAAHAAFPVCSVGGGGLPPPPGLRHIPMNESRIQRTALPILFFP